MVISIEFEKKKTPPTKPNQTKPPIQPTDQPANTINQQMNNDDNFLRYYSELTLNLTTSAST